MQVIRHWLEDHIIDNSKIDNTGAFTLGSVTASDMSATDMTANSLHVLEHTTLGGITLFTDGSFVGNVIIHGTLEERSDSTFQDTVLVTQDEDRPAIIAQQTTDAPAIQVTSSGTGTLLDMTGYNSLSNPAIKIRHDGVGGEVMLTPNNIDGVVGTHNYGMFSVYTNNTEAIRITPEGKVAISSDGIDPVNQLDVSGTVGAFGAIITGIANDPSPVVQLSSNGLAASINMNCAYATASNPAIQIYHPGYNTRVILGPIVGSGVVGTNSYSDFRVYSNNMEAIRVKPSGKVAIGNGIDPLQQLDVMGSANIRGDATVNGNISGVDMSCYCIGVGTSPSGTYAAAIYGSTKGGISTDTDLVGAYGISASGVTRGGVVGAGSGGTGDATSLIVRNNSGSGKFIKCEGYGAQEKFTVEYEGRTSIGKSFDNSYRQLDVTTGNTYRYGIVSQSEQLPAILANCNASGNNPAIVANGHNIAGFFDAGFDHIGTGDSTGIIVRSMGSKGNIIEGWNHLLNQVFVVDHAGDVTSTNVRTGNIVATGNINATNITATGTLSSSSNFFAPNISASGSIYTNTIETNSGPNVTLNANLIAAANVSTSGIIYTNTIAANSGPNVILDANLIVTGDVTASNVCPLLDSSRFNVTFPTSSTITFYYSIFGTYSPSVGRVVLSWFDSAPMLPPAIAHSSAASMVPTKLRTLTRLPGFGNSSPIELPVIVKIKTDGSIDLYSVDWATSWTTLYAGTGQYLINL